MKKILLLTIDGIIIFILSALGLIVFGNEINWSIFWALIFSLQVFKHFLPESVIDKFSNWFDHYSPILTGLILVLMFFYLIRITSSNVALTVVFFLLIILAGRNPRPDRE